ncbi:hypothetical protein VW23_006895 [Devosia insulae DS-56]|uniref:Serine protease n=1 Tax=Devosia insulae DS-56 TaxID=1116389 RepID=A0A1E5XHA0_9HYPH|nr:serine protease [Devosia insulae]OEO27978.1 hypothetical protein VW23_006895 [Devosia insulae DS-56]
MAGFRGIIEDARKANRDHNLRGLTEACERLAAELPEPRSAAAALGVTLLKELRNWRRYDHIQAVAEAFIKAGYRTPRIWTIYAQALVDRGNQVAAIGILGTLLAEPTDEMDAEMSEIHGIRGRAWKDIAYEAIGLKRRGVAARALERASEYYRKGLATKPEDLHMLAWHGAQLVALAAFAKRHELDTGMAPHHQLAERIRARMTAAHAGGNHDPWTLGAAGEMAVAFGDLEEALQWYSLAIATKRTDAFTLASMHRQLSQIWGIGATSAGSTIEGLLLDALMRQGGEFQLSRASAEQLQARIGGAQPVSVRSIRHALRAAESVAMIRSGFSPLGTGFLTTAQSLGLDAEIGLVVVTNAHVVSNPPQGGAASPDDVQVTFELSKPDVEYTVDRIVKCLPVQQHDCTVLKLKGEIDLKPLPVSDMPDVLPKDPTAVVIGHPLGQEISFSFLDGRLLGFEPKADDDRPQRMHYRSPTERGSSGSPVFNRNWQVIGLHHRYLPNATPLNNKPGTYEANEGISIGSICRAFRSGRG